MLIRKVQPEKVLAEMTGAGFKGRVIRSSLSPEQEQRLQAALSQARQQDVAGEAAGAGAAAAPLPSGASPAGAGAT